MKEKMMSGIGYRKSVQEINGCEVYDLVPDDERNRYDFVVTMVDGVAYPWLEDIDLDEVTVTRQAIKEHGGWDPKGAVINGDQVVVTHRDGFVRFLPPRHAQRVIEGRLNR